MQLINTVETENLPDTSLLTKLVNNVIMLVSALIEKVRISRAGGTAVTSCVERLVADTPPVRVDISQTEDTGV